MSEAQFIFENLGKFKTLKLKSWKDRGIEHGFTGSDLNLTGSGREASAKLLTEILGLKALLIPNQTHSEILIDARGSKIHKLLSDPNSEEIRSEADAIVFDWPLPDGIACGIRTADCLPILILGENAGAVVHAGWRGLANGIIKKALGVMGPQENLEALIGPCAGGSSYEVGKEVISAIGDSVVYLDSDRPDHYLLNLSQTALRQIIEHSPKTNVYISGTCTITDKNFHSYRRDKDQAGRNLGFLASNKKIV